MGDLERPLSCLQLGAVLGWKVPNLAQALALPPIGVGSVDDGHLVACFQVQLIGVARLEVVQDHVQVCGQKPLMFLKLDN